MALFDRLLQPGISLLFEESFGKNDNIFAMVSVVGKGRRLIAQEELLVAGVDGGGKLLNLVAGVVDIEFTADFITGKAQHGGQRVAKDAAAGVPQVHGAGGIGGDKLHIDPFALTVVDVTVSGALFADGTEDFTVPALRKPEVDEAGTGDRDRGEKAPVQGAVFHQRVGDLARRHMKRAGTDHRVVCGIVAIGDILRDFHGAGELGARGERLGGNSRVISIAQQIVCVLFCKFNQISHLPSPSL